MYVTTYKCHICKTSKEVVHTLYNPTIKDFNDSELLKNCDGKDLHVCFECEAKRNEEEDE